MLTQSCHKVKKSSSSYRVAGWTGLEPAAFRVTGGRYNQLNYHPAPVFEALDYTDEGRPLQLFLDPNIEDHPSWCLKYKHVIPIGYAG